MSTLNRRKTDTSAWLEKTNPLAGLSLRAAQSIYDAARGKGSAMLQRIYAEIEAADPVLMTCVDRRGSALAGLGWRAVAASDAKDEVLADEQKDFISRLAGGITNFTEAIEHLDLAFFRGFSHVQPVWEGDKVKHVVLLNSWNFLHEAGEWYWNPECQGGTQGLEKIGPAMRLVTVRRPRAIDYPAMSIHIRKALGERDWGRFTERYGLPPVDAIMGAGATEEQRSEYLVAADAARDGLPVVWPAGAQVSRAEGARGQDPFTAFIEHQEKLVVLMATGGTLTSLAQADTGALAGGAQMDVWEQIVRRDAAIIGDAIDRHLFRSALETAFPGKPIVAHFEIGKDAEPSADEVFDLAAKARTAGYKIERSELEETSGYTLVEDTAAMQGGFGSFANAAMPLQLRQNALQNARKGEDASDVPQEAETPVGAILSGFARDLGPVADKIKVVLAIEDDGKRRQAASELADELPGMIPNDPELAYMLEEAMAQEFASAISEGETVENAKDECRAKDPTYCPVHGTPEGQESRKSPRNDGKIVFNNPRKKADADNQSRNLGYKDIDDLMAQSVDVPQAKIDEILRGGHTDCEPHEAVATLRTLSVIDSNNGEKVKLTEFALRHYVCGERRNEPDISRLRTLPQAIDAIRHPDGVEHMLDNRPVLPDPNGKYPAKTQTVFSSRIGKRGSMRVHAYTDQGVLSGWHVKK